MDEVILTKEGSLIQLDERNDLLRKVTLYKNEVAAKVVLALDISKSMDESIKNGNVQRIIDRLLPIALTLSSTFNLDFWVFNNKSEHMPSIGRENYFGYVLDNKLQASGRTRYAEVMADIVSHHFIVQPSHSPIFVMMVTDEQNEDVTQASEVLRASSYFPIFWQFIGLGQEKRFNHLNILNNISDRYIINSDYLICSSLSDINYISDSKLYSSILSEYPYWVKATGVREMLSKWDTLATSADMRDKIKVLRKNSSSAFGIFYVLRKLFK